MVSPSFKNPLHAILFSSLVLYVFFGLILSAKGFGSLKIIFVIVALTTGTILLPKFFLDDSFRNKMFLITVVIITIFNYFIRGDMESFALLLSLPLGYLFYKYSIQFKQFLIILLIIQFTALLYEWLSRDFIYLETSTGLINSSTALDFTAEAWKADEESGFRAKGLFLGSLLANTFTINMAIIFRKQKIILFICLLMAVMTNGRLAFIITLILIFLNFQSSKSGGLRVSVGSRIIRWGVASFFITVCLVLVINITSETAINHFFEVINLDSDSNKVRIELTFGGLFIYLNNFSFGEQIFGGNRDLGQFIFTTAESEWVNLLLDVGLAGMLLYLIPMLWLIFQARTYNKVNISSLTKALPSSIGLLLFAMIVYRHVTSYTRGGMFWFIIFSSFYELDKMKLIIDKLRNPN